MHTTLPVLNSRFKSYAHYRSRAGTSYALLPLRFGRLDESRYVLTNFAGEHVVLPCDTLREFLEHRLSMHTAEYDELKSRHFLLDGDSTVAIDLLAAKYRTKQSFLERFASLFMFVVTLRCEHTCSYCQVSRRSEDQQRYDMSPEVAERAIDFMFKSPSRQLKVEFQGGESLLNFERIRSITLEVKRRNEVEGREIAFVVATNLAPLTDEHLAFCREHDIHISTSLDGPRELHNRNRPRPGRDSYERAIAGINRVRAALGYDRVAALMTTTESSLQLPKQIVDEYVRQGFRSIFLRSLSPYGFAVRTGQAHRYDVERWLDFYREGLAYVIELNQRGVRIREEYATIILRKILTSYPSGYVDLQSPAGIVTSCLVFNYDGGIYASDESRMLAEMGDETFRIGNLADEDSFARVTQSDFLFETLSRTITESVPMCADCPFQPYCGADPVFHHATQGDVVGHKPTSAFCRKNMALFRHLIRLLEDDPQAAVILRSWV